MPFKLFLFQGFAFKKKKHIIRKGTDWDLFSILSWKVCLEGIRMTPLFYNDQTFIVMILRPWKLRPNHPIRNKSREILNET